MKPGTFLPASHIARLHRSNLRRQHVITIYSSRHAHSDDNRKREQYS